MKPSQLTLIPLLERAGRLFADTEIVSQRPDNSTHRYTYGDLYRRARALAAVLQDCGLRPGDRVATLMWNHHLHLEAYFGVPVAGGVLHTLNLRLHPDELASIVNHAEDRFLIVDDVLLPVFERIKRQGEPGARHRHAVRRRPVPPGYEDYEALLRQSRGVPRYPDLDENDPAAMCYTSGTTGTPKGVVYSHRTIALHSYSISLPDNFAITRHDTILAAMSMFHANAWGLPYAGVMNGSRLILPGPNLQPERILDLLSDASGDVDRGRADDLARRAPGARRAAGPLAAGEGRAHDRRRIRRARNAVPALRRARAAGHSAVGTDRDRADGHRLHAQAAHGRVVRRRAIRAAREAGHRHRRSSSSASSATTARCRGTGRRREKSRCGGHGSRPATTRCRRGEREVDRRTGGFAPATWRPSTPMAT